MMINMIKMDLYRIFRTKSMYVIWIILAVCVLFTTYLCTYDYESLQEANGEEAVWQEEISLSEEDEILIGLTVTLPTKAGEKITVYDVFFGNCQGRFYALFFMIFAVLFSAADISSGYIKNIGGQVRNRGWLVVSKAAALSVFAVLTLIGAFFWQAVANVIFFGYLVWGSASAIVPYFMVELLLHYVLMLICMAAVIFIKNSVVSMIFSICLGLNVFTIVYEFFNRIVWKLMQKEISLYTYTVSGQISMLSMNPDKTQCLTACAVALVFLLVAVTAAGVVFQKRDI